MEEGNWDKVNIWDLERLEWNQCLIKSVLSQGNVKCRDTETYQNTLGVHFLLCPSVLIVSMILRIIPTFYTKIWCREAFLKSCINLEKFRGTNLRGRVGEVLRTKNISLYCYYVFKKLIPPSNILNLDSVCSSP